MPSRLDWIKKSDLDEITDWLCNLIDVTAGDCDKCVAASLCWIGHKGFKYWLLKPIEKEWTDEN